MSEFSKRIRDELDFREEARNAAMLRRNFQGEPRVVVPEVVTELVTRRVLVLEYVEGTRIDRLHERLASGELDLQRLVETVVDAYIKMMLEDGVFHADPHAGNLLVDPQGRLVLLDFGMVLQVERETRRRLVETVLAAARQDVDGVINGFYELGILDPDVDRGTVRDAAQSLMAVSLRDDDLAAADPAAGRAGTADVLRVAADAAVQPGLLRPGGRARRGDRAPLRPELQRARDGPAGARPLGEAADAGRARAGPARAASPTGPRRRSPRRATLRDLVRRVERDELRVRWHPRDTLELQRFLAQQVRRALLALFAFTIAVIASVVYLATRRLEVLVLGLLIAFGMFFVIFLLPTHLFQNPLRFRRRWPAAERVARSGPASGAASPSTARRACGTPPRPRPWPAPGARGRRRWPARIPLPASENSTTWRWLLIRSRSSPRTSAISSRRTRAARRRSSQWSQPWSTQAASAAPASSWTSVPSSRASGTHERHGQRHAREIQLEVRGEVLLRPAAPSRCRKGRRPSLRRGGLEAGPPALHRRGESGSVQADLSLRARRRRAGR